MSTDSKTDTDRTRSVNSQITDAITQSNAMLTGMAPAHSMAALYQTMSQAMGTGAQNVVSNQQHVNSVGLAALTQNLQLLLQPSGHNTTIIQVPAPVLMPIKSRQKPKPKKSVDEEAE